MRELSIRGQPLWVHDNEALSNHIVREQDFYEAPILDYLRDHFNDQQVIVDIGANIGNHTVYFSRYLKNKCIYAFEPLPANFEVLSKNVEALENITIFSSALSDIVGNLKMQPNSENWGAGEVVEGGSVDVSAVTLDSLELQNVSLLKIDVENFEPQVLHGAQETISNNNPIILIEDNYQRYSNLLPNYSLIKGWDINRTYLYVPKGWY